MKLSSGREFKGSMKCSRHGVQRGSLVRPAHLSTSRMTVDVAKHHLVPKHGKLSDAEKAKLLEHYHIKLKALARISKSDPAIVKLNPKEGDIIKIERDSKTAGKSIYYRVVSI